MKAYLLGLESITGVNPYDRFNEKSDWFDFKKGWEDQLITNY
jgi:hypothetical protein